MNEIKIAFVKLLEQKKYNSLKDLLSTMNPSDVAVCMGEIDEESLAKIFRLLPKELAADTFVEMDSQQQELLIRAFSDSELKAIVNELYMDDAVDIIEEMPANMVKRILQQADSETRKLINEMLKYPDDSAGSLMTTEFVDLSPTMTAGEAIDHIRQTGIDSETIDICYVADDTRVLLGAVSIRSIILAAKDAPIGSFMQTNLICVTTQEDQETVAQMFAKYNFTVLPVVDSEKRLVGIVTVDDAIDVLQAETTEDIEKMAAVAPVDKPYLHRTVIELFRSRVGWLLLLMISATFTGMIITRFENALAACIVLTSFIPMIMDTGGNSGSQASVTIIRSLTLGEIAFSDVLRIIWKEARVALLCGVSLAAVSFAKLLLVDRVGAAVALTVCLTLMVTVLAAKVVGCSLPILAKKIGLDPAVMASPLITTVVDAVSLVIYFTLATAILGI